MEHKIYGRTLRLNVVMGSKSVCFSITEQNVMTTPTNKGDKCFFTAHYSMKCILLRVYIEEAEDSQTGKTNSRKW